MPGQVTGTIGQEEVRFENAATESTLEMLVATMNGIAKKLGVKGKDYEKELKSLKKEREVREKNSNELKDEIDTRRDLNKELDTSRKKLSNAVEDFSNVVQNLFTGTTPTIAGFTSAFADVPVVGTLIASLGKILDQNVQGFRKLSNSGMLLGDSLFSAQQAAARAEIPFNLFAETLSKHSSSLGLFAGNATEGARRFGEISKRLKADGVGQKLANLGYSIESITEGTATYLDIQTRLGRSQTMTDQQLSSGAETFLYQLDELSRATGIQRDALLASATSISEDPRLEALLANMSEAGQKNLLGVTSVLDNVNKQLSNGVKDLVATNGIPSTDFGKALARNNPEILESSRLLRAGSISQQEFIDVVKRAASNTSNLTDEEEKLHAYLVARRKSSPYADRIALMSAKRLGEGFDKAIEAQQEAMNNQKLTAAGLDQALTKIRAAFVSAFIETGALDAFASGLSILIEVVGNVVGRFVKLADDIQNLDISTAIANFFDPVGAIAKDVEGKVIYKKDKEGKDTTEPERARRSIFEIMELPVADGIKDLFTSPKTYMVLAGAIGGLFAASVVKKAVVGTFSALTSTVADKITFGKGAGAAAGKGAAMAGARFGKGAEKSLAGLGKGLAAIGHPRALLGVAALAGIGFSIGLVASGFGKFAALDWETIKGGLAAVAGLGVIAGVMGAFVGPVMLGAAALGAIGLALQTFPTDSLEAISRTFEGFGKVLGITLEGINSVLATVSGAILGTVSNISAGIGNVIDKFSNYKTASIDATTKQLTALASIPTDTLDKLAVGITAVKVAIKDISPGAFEGISKGVGSLFAGDTAKSLERISATAPNFKVLSDALAAVDFNKLDPTKVSFDTFSIGAKKVNELSLALASVNSQLKEISKPTLADSVKGIMDQVSTTISTALAPAESKDAETKRHSTLLTAIDSKMETLNITMKSLLDVQEDAKDGIKSTAKNTKNARGNFYG